MLMMASLACSPIPGPQVPYTLFQFSRLCQVGLPRPLAILEPEELLHLLLAERGPPKAQVQQVIFFNVDCLHRQVPRWCTLPDGLVCAKPLPGDVPP
jgi:hypothetical protein